MIHAKMPTREELHKMKIEDAYKKYIPKVLTDEMIQRVEEHKDVYKMWKEMLVEMTLAFCK